MKENVGLDWKPPVSVQNLSIIVKRKRGRKRGGEKGRERGRGKEERVRKGNTYILVLALVLERECDSVCYRAVCVNVCVLMCVC